ncbi:hypothetical protein CC78DRAFT_166470 [Lojkania enalia]|uniref:Uncharacterized protein n=1 Tax=Lojkania enalia TaxID=147567 RepID=A0A9P4JY95_9PLEO|nr:hypothetical protein CC78DRAFT_166470 [Didymosphaeria enalia]
MSTLHLTEKIRASKFFMEWRGHPIEDLKKFRDITIAHRPNKPIVYLAGDSSLDNKAWVPSSGPEGVEILVEVPEIYHSTLDRPRPKPDVAFWLNHILGDRATVLNTAVEESMLRERDDQLLPHDKFIRDNIRAQDILIVSVGANDVALRPTVCTIRHMLQLAWLTRHASLETGSASSLKYFKHMFGDKVQNYVARMISNTKPKAVIICMIYFPLEASAGPQQSWADVQLKTLGYNKYPGQLQTAIKKMYEMATKQIKIEGTWVLPCALYEPLDGKNAGDYTARVEPSASGGRKLAEKFMQILECVISK